jgi:hypothetical protein
MACRTASSCARAFALATLLTFAAFAAFAALAAGTAHAADPSPADKTFAQSLFDEGRHLMDQGRYAEACPRLADSERLDPGGGTVLNLALCYDKLGKLALAYGTYEDAISRAIAEQRHERETFARERVAALAPRLPHLTIVVTGTDAATVTLDGSSVPKSAWGIATPVDPGEHTVEASAPGFTSAKTTLTLAEGQARDAAVALAPLPATPPPSPPSAYSRAVYVPLPPPPPATRRSTAFYVLGGLAGASLVASAVTGDIAWSAHESVASKCSSQTDFCSDPTGISDASRARTFAWLSTGTLAAGAVLGVLTFALPLSEPVTVGVAPAPGAGGTVAFRAAWR